MDERTAAVLLEPIQGESGVNLIDGDVLAAARAACDRVGAALVFDEVQTGMGRTGTLWAYEATGVVPDAMTVAKALGGGLPIGALITGPRLADVLAPGDHGSTFAGGPVVAAAAHAALDVLDDPALLARVRELGERLQERLRELPGVLDVRGARADGGRRRRPLRRPRSCAAPCSSSGWWSTRPARRRSASCRRSSSTQAELDEGVGRLAPLLA